MPDAKSAACRRSYAAGSFSNVAIVAVAASIPGRSPRMNRPCSKRAVGGDVGGGLRFVNAATREAADAPNTARHRKTMLHISNYNIID